MAYGYWGRVPIGNLIVTKFFFSCVAARLFTKRVLNRLKTRPGLLMDAAECRQAVLKFIESGYDKFSIGGGPKNLEGFVNIDFVGHKNVHREIVADVTDLSFIPTGCASQIHSNHVLEHFQESELKHQLAEYARILKPQGTLSVRCPNALGAALGFWFPPVLETNREEFIRLGFPVDENFHNPADVWTHRDVFGLLHWFYGDVGARGDEHLILLTPTKLRKLLTEMGFSIAAMAEPEAVNLVAIATKTLSTATS